MNQGGKREDFEEESNENGLEWWERGPSPFKSEDPKPNPDIARICACKLLYSL